MRIIVALVLLSLAAIASATETGPYLAVSPATDAVHLHFDYDRAGTDDTVHPDDSLPVWAVELGWRVAPGWSLAIERLDSPNSLRGRHHEYVHLLLRTEWYPTADRWWVGLGLGLAEVQGLAQELPWGGTVIPRGSGVVFTGGTGLDLPLADHWAVRGRLDLLVMRHVAVDTGDRMNAVGLRTGLLLIWRP